jgi:hypothetical protein
MYGTSRGLVNLYYAHRRGPNAPYLLLHTLHIVGSLPGVHDTNQPLVLTTSFNTCIVLRHRQIITVLAKLMPQ